MKPTIEELEVIAGMRYVLYEIRESLSRDPKYIGELIICEKALQKAREVFGPWDGSGLIVTSCEEIEKWKNQRLKN